VLADSVIASAVALGGRSLTNAVGNRGRGGTIVPIHVGAGA